MSIREQVIECGGKAGIALVFLYIFENLLKILAHVSNIYEYLIPPFLYQNVGPQIMCVWEQI